MKKIITILWVLLILTSCSNPKDLEKIEELEMSKSQLQAEVSKLTLEVEDNIFQKNKECWLLDEEIKQYLFDPQYLMRKFDPQIDEVFYSKKRNSCLFSFSYQKFECENIDFSSDLWQELNCLSKDKQLVDFFTKKILVTSDWMYQKSKYDCLDNAKKDEEYDDCNSRFDFKTKVQAYK